MTSEELAATVEEQIRRCRSRVLGVGHEQYANGDRQKFEQISLDRLFEETAEELDDLLVYLVMLKIRLDRMNTRIIRRFMP